MAAQIMDGQCGWIVPSFFERIFSKQMGKWRGLSAEACLSDRFGSHLRSGPSAVDPMVQKGSFQVFTQCRFSLDTLYRREYQVWFGRWATICWAWATNKPEKATGAWIGRLQPCLAWFGPAAALLPPLFPLSLNP
jgi:hypothetical protein